MRVGIDVWKPQYTPKRPDAQTHLLPEILSPMASPAADAPSSGDHHYVYVLECSDGSLYTGYTTDVERRVEEHNDGTAAKYTRGRRPVKLVHVESCEDRSDALQREHAIKQLRRASKEQLIDGSPETGS